MWFYMFPSHALPKSIFSLRLPCSSIAPAPYPVAPCFPCVAPSPSPSVVGSTTRWNQAHPQCAQATQMIQPYQGHQPMEMVYHQVISSTPQVHHPLVSSPQPLPVPVSSDPSVSWSAVSRTERPHTRWSAQGNETKQAGLGCELKQLLSS